MVFLVTFLTGVYIIIVDIQEQPDSIPLLQYAIDADVIHEISNTYLGKNIIITSRKKWNASKIISAYRSQYIIEWKHRFNSLPNPPE